MNASEMGATSQRQKAVPQIAAAANGAVARIRDLGWLVRMVIRFAPVDSAYLALVVLGQSILVPAQLWFTKHLVDGLGGGPSAAAHRGVYVWTALLLISLLIGKVLASLQPMLQASVREQAGPQLHEMTLRKTASLSLVNFEYQAYYDQLSRVLSDTETRGPQTLQHTLDLLGALPVMIGYVVALATVTPALLFIVVGASASAALFWVLNGQTHGETLKQLSRGRRLYEYYAQLLTDRNAAKELRLYGLSDHLFNRWRQSFWQVRTARRRFVISQLWKQRAVLLIADGAIMLGLLWVVLFRTVRVSAGQYALLFQSIGGVIQRAFSLSGTLQTLGEHSVYAAELRALLQSPDADQHTAGQGSLQDFPAVLKQGIRFENVSFTYPGADHPAVSELNLTIRAGEKVALVGENGAGKSTLVKLLLGLYQPDAGRITFDGIDARAIDPKRLRLAMSAVLQPFVRYQLTLGENVGLGQPERLHDRHSIETSVVKAGAGELLAQLEQGYATRLGPEVGGAELSGGQWQRLAIARGFFRNAQILVLDEPTASLDPIAELAVFEQFSSMALDRTAVMISHRLGMARLADRIFVLADGRLVEAGSHEQLITTPSGQYASLFRAQARWYE